jgi:hypothetical protein
MPKTLEFPVILSSGSYTGTVRCRPSSGVLHGYKILSIDVDCPAEELTRGDERVLRTEAARAVLAMDDAESMRAERTAYR